MRLYRSLLFSPGIRPELMDKAQSSGADALIFDLEDSVAREAKPEARQHVGRVLSRADSLPVYVRINHPDGGDAAADVATLTGTHVEGVILPKAERPLDIERVAALLETAEARLRIADGSLAIIPMIETCLGLRNAYDLIASSRRVRGMAIASGEEGDLMVDLGGRWTASGEALSYPRGRLVCEARAAGLSWLIDGVFMNLQSDDALRRESEIARNIGYIAKMAIHPRQLNVIHDVFTPTPEEVEYARGLIAAFRAGEQQGHGAVRYRGMMVDYANVKRAERTLALASSASQ
jgi:citrate lyase subunit beta/citryl-CoA lyase